MNDRAGIFVNNLSRDMAYQSFRPAPLPPNPPVEFTNDLIASVMKSPRPCGA